MQSDEKIHDASAALSLCGIALKKWRVKKHPRQNAQTQKVGAVARIRNL